MRYIRRFLPYLWIAVAFALLHLVWVAASRQMADRSMERSWVARQGRAAGVTPAVISSTELRIPWFYANTPAILEGEHAVVCYGVENARRVRLDPPVEDLQPAFNRCFSVSPQATTRYVLTAEGADGRKTTASFTLEVNPAPPRIEYIELSSRELRRGELMTMCYAVKHATSVKLEPWGPKLPGPDRGCVRMVPARGGKYTFVAVGDAGRTDRETFTLTVK